MNDINGDFYRKSRVERKEFKNIRIYQTSLPKTPPVRNINREEPSFMVDLFQSLIPVSAPKEVLRPCSGSDFGGSNTQGSIEQFRGSSVPTTNGWEGDGRGSRLAMISS